MSYEIQDYHDNNHHELYEFNEDLSNLNNLLNFDADMFGEDENL